MKKFTVLSFTVLLAFSSHSLAQSKIFRWGSESGMCEYEGTYNSKKYTAAKLRNTKRLIGSDFYLDLTTATVWKYEEIESLNFAQIEVEYKRKSVELKNLNIVKSPFWELQRQLRLKELEQYYWLVKTTMASYKRRESLREYPYAESCKAKYAEPLIASGDSLLKVWEMVNIETRNNNADPARIKRIFDEQRKSPDALKFAVVEVTAFGWWNCANALIDQGNYEIREKNFRKLFTRVRTVYCEEP